jgi:CDP-diacylglycerol---serine O-phosphatidyltransferase
VRMRVPPELVLPVFVGVIIFVALLIGYPWHLLSAGSALYLLSLPLGWKSYRDHARKYAAASAAAVPEAGAAPANSAPPLVAPPVDGAAAVDDRPDRLH